MSRTALASTRASSTHTPWNWLNWCGVLAVLAITHTALFGQSASLSGRLIDPSGSQVPNAEVTLLRDATGVAVQAQSNEDGLYIFPFVSPGQYTVNVAADGFKSFQQSAVVQTGQRMVLDIRLELGNRSESITVEANALGLAVNTTDATKGNPFNTRAILQLPLEGRNVAGLLSLQSGVTFLTDDPLSKDVRNGSVNGAQTNQSNITLDGVDVNDQESKLPFTSALRTTLDSVQEFRVVTTNANADMGRSSGAQVSLITKSGGNSPHGSLYEFHRNNATAANDFFNNRAGVEKPKLIRNVFGGSVGGPVVRNRLFFFFNYEGRRDASDSIEIRQVPLPSLRNGTIRYLNTSETMSELSPAQLRALDPAGIGANSAVLSYLQQYPLPNDTSTGDGINWGGYRFTSKTPLSWNTSIARLDWNAGNSGAHQFFLRGNLQADRQQSAPQFPGQPPNTVLTGNSKGLAFGYTATLTPTLVSTFRYGLTRVGSNSAGVMNQSRSDLYIVNEPYFGTTTSLARVLPVHTVSEDLSWIHGSHSLQFGGVFRSIRNRRLNNDTTFNEVWADSNALLDGNLLRMPDLSSLWVQPFESSVMGMLGLINGGVARYNYTIDGQPLPEGTSIRRNFGMEEAEFYIQDTWRAMRGLTLTAGLRWSLMPPVREVTGAQVSIVPGYSEYVDRRVALADAGLPSRDAGLITFVAKDSPQGQPLYPFHKNNFAPRLSVAYSPQATEGWLAKLFGGAGKTSIRAGAGIYYDLYGMEIMDQLDKSSFGLSSTIGIAPIGLSMSTAPRYTSMYDLPSQLLPAAPPGGPGTPPEEGFGWENTVDSSLRAPYSINFNLSIARDIGAGFSFEIGYVGRLGRRTLTTENSAATQADFRDPASGERLFASMRKLETQVRSNTPVSAIQPIAFWENMYPDAAGNGLTATQAVYGVMQLYSPDPTSALYSLDIDCDPACSKLGPYTFFNPQYGQLAAVRSIGSSDYHSFQWNLRKRFSRNFQFDLNYTLSKSMDLASVWGGYSQGLIDGYSTWTIINPWDRKSQRAVSDYDLRHQWNANWVAELPVGKGQRYLNTASPVADAILGGWQVSGLLRITSGLPISVLNTRGWPNGWCCPHYAEVVGAVPAQTSNKNAPLIGGSSGPNLFDNPIVAIRAFDSANVGPASNRNNLRGQGVFTIDLSLGKRFKLPREGHSIQVRAEAFNLTNSVRFKPDLFGTVALQDPGVFGNYNTVMTPARVMQFGVRYEF